MVELALFRVELVLFFDEVVDSMVELALFLDEVVDSVVDLSLFLVEPLLPGDEVMDLGCESGEAFGQLDELVGEDEAAHRLVELGVLRQEPQEVVAGVDGRCHVIRISVRGWDTG